MDALENNRIDVAMQVNLSDECCLDYQLEYLLMCEYRFYWKMIIWLLLALLELK